MQTEFATIFFVFCPPIKKILFKKEVLFMFLAKEDGMLHAAGMAFFTLVSVVLTIPFIFYAKDIAESVRVIAGRKTIDEGKSQ
ncbi:hypothetical protein PTH_1965 [Pelotomaculum thermopropionicum SI]|uniref:Uncharacterized protein n=1 Tax=Pelotomaculum thermopropionicum (strain DSM 13744 / JCM 10971 / SI) TaxID=370438 RepID=A5D0S4_PELTS|nr:hypothetical protein PTH_1965 [Pelotomaculum thermopropionicum SI]